MMRQKTKMAHIGALDPEQDLGIYMLMVNGL